MLRILILIFTILFFKTDIAVGQENDLELNLSNFLNEQLISLDKTWNPKGYWGDAWKEKDNRFNEAIMFYLAADNDQTRYFETRILKAIEFSFQFLQHESGALMQKGKPSHVRTSLFLHGVAKTALKFPELYRDPKIRLGIRKASKWLAKPHDFSSNQNIAAMMAMHTLFLSTKKTFYRDLWLKYREGLIRDFIYIEPGKGYWPEAPSNWRNRLNTPYLFVQSFFLQEYQTMKKDSEIETIHKHLLLFLKDQIDISNVTLDLRNSYSYSVNSGPKNAKISSASVFWTKGFNLSSKEKYEILIKTKARFIKNKADVNYLSNTDIYYRFAIINNIMKNLSK